MDSGERLRCLGPTPGTGNWMEREKNCAWWWPPSTPGLAWELSNQTDEFGPTRFGKERT